MKKLLKIIAGLVILTFVLIIAAMVILPMVIDPNDFKPQIVDAVKQQTGRDLQIEGELGLNVFPKVGLSLGKTQLSNAAGFGEKPFASMQSVNIQLALMPLFSKQVEMDEIVIDGLSLNLHRNKAGKNNWDDLAAGHAEKADDKNSADGRGKGQQLQSLRIGGINIRDANISWQDETTDDHYQISRFSLVSGEIQPDQPVDIELTSQFSSKKHEANGTLNFAGNVLVALESGAIKVNGMRLGAEVDAKQVMAGRVKLGVESKAISFKSSEQQLEPADMLINLEFDIQEPKLKGDLKTTAKVSADLTAQKFNLNNLMTEINANGEPLNNRETNVKLNVSALQADLKAQTAKLDGLQLNALGLAINGQMSGNAILSELPKFNGRLDLAQFNAREVLKALGQEVPKTADENVLKKVSAGFAVAGSSKMVSMKNLKVVLDDTNLTGQMSINDFSKQAVAFDLNVDTIDLDRYLPPPTEGGKVETPAKPAAADAEAEIFPVETLRKLNANGTARIGELKVNNLKAADIVVKLKANAGHVNVKPSAKLYKGKYDADATIDVRKQTPEIKSSSKLNGVQIEPLLKDLQGDAKLAGATNTNFSITAKGNTANAIKKTLNGNASFSFTNGALVGVNIAKILREGLAKLEGKTAKSSNEPEKTDFSELKGTAKITDGLVTNKDFTMKSPLLRVAGEGKVNLPEENLNYLVKASVVGSLKGQGGEGLEKLKGITVPVRVSGPFSDLSYKPDLSAALSDKVKQKAKEKIDEKKEEVKDKLKDKLKDKFKGLF